MLFASAADAAPTSNSNPCDQIVVLGRVVGAKYLGQLDDFNGLWNYDIDVRRVLRGQEPRRPLVILAAGPDELRGGVELAFFLSRGPNNEYGLVSADLDLRRARSQLASCPPLNDR